MSRRSALAAIIVLSIFGIAISSVSLVNHYSPSKSSYCSFGDNFNCDIVNRSIYSQVSGVPVALIGLAGYAVLAVLSWLTRRGNDQRGFLVAGAVIGLGFSLYLTYIEKYVLATWCVLCLSSFAIIVLITILSLLAMRSSQPVSS
jgi:vitamin-K-epoxide reductase (warfarin-sensitive)